MSNIFLPEHFKIVSATPIGVVTTNGGTAFDVINLEQAVMVWLVAQFLQDVGHATTIQPVVGINVAAATAITFNTEWWRNANMAATDTLVAQAVGTTAPCTAAATDQMIVIKIDPADVVAQNATFSYLGGTIATSAQATNFVSATWYIQNRYPQATPATAIV
jgi:hypothetical protein